MKKHLLATLSIVTLCLITFLSTNAMAAFSCSIDTSYNSGDPQVEFKLYLTTDETISVDGYQFEFTYDTSELSYMSYTNTPLSGIYEDALASFSVDQSNGSLDGFSAASFSSSAVIEAGAYLLGTFTFETTSVIEDGLTDFNIDYLDNMLFLGVGLEYYNNSSILLSNFTDIRSGSSVPIPGTGLLMGMGILGLASIRRKTA